MAAKALRGPMRGFDIAEARRRDLEAAWRFLGD
jgi:hypothetical protein